MEGDSSQKSQGAPPDPRGQRLSSWKEIAAYLKASERSVRRWEKTEGLPVRRHLHRKRDGIFASTQELDAWWEGRKSQLEPHRTAPAPAKPRPRRRSVLAASLLAVALTAGYLAWQRFQPASPLSGRVMLAVLPFENLTGDPGQQFFCDGITEEMIAELGALHRDRLGVIARTSSMKFRDTRKNVREIGGELGVDYVLEGSVRREGDGVRITAHLIRSSDQTLLWARTFERDTTHILAVQAEVAAAVAREIQLQLTPSQEARLAAGRTVNRQAFEAYLRGRYALNRRTAGSVQEAIGYFRAAIQQDPAYAAPYVGLADAYNQQGTFAIGGRSPRETRQLARAAARRALEIDDRMAEAYAALGYSELYDWNWKEAEICLQQAQELNPSYPWVHLWYASFLLVHSRPEEAVRSAERALELDPLSPIVETQLGWVLNFAGREDEAMARYQSVLEKEPEFVWALWQLGSVYLQKERHAEAIALLEKALPFSGRSPAILGRLGEALARAGHTAEAEKILAELTELSRKRYVSPLAFSSVYQGLGQRDEYFYWTEKAFQERANGMLYLKLWPLNRSMSDDPRFHSLLRRMNYPNP
jgi:TolB-like protein/cytochrome c-type biogenesis protein CcmH/NrfG